MGSVVDGRCGQWWMVAVQQVDSLDAEMSASWKSKHVKLFTLQVIVCLYLHNSLSHTHTTHTHKDKDFCGV